MTVNWPSQRRVQPATNIPINRANSLFAGAAGASIALWTPTAPAGATVSGVTYRGTTRGTVGVFNGSSTYVAHRVAGTGTSGVTMFALVRGNAAPSVGGVVSQVISRTDTGGFATLNFAWDHPTPSFYKAWAIHDGSSWIPVAYSSLSANTWYLLSATHSPVFGVRIYLDGALAGSAPGATGFVSAPAPEVFIGSGGSGSTPVSYWAGEIAVAGYIGASLNDAAHQSLARNIWQLYAPVVRPAQFAVAAAGSGATISVPTGAVSVAGYAPTVTATANQTISVPVGAVSLTGFAPTVSTSASQTISVPAGAVSLTGYAPTVFTTAVTTIAVPVGAVSLAGFAPTISYTTHAYIDVPKGAVGLTGYAPTVLGGESGIWTPVTVDAATWTPQ